MKEPKDKLKKNGWFQKLMPSLSTRVGTSYMSMQVTLSKRRKNKKRYKVSSSTTTSSIKTSNIMASSIKMFNSMTSSIMSNILNSITNKHTMIKIITTTRVRTSLKITGTSTTSSL